jgi:ABC-type sugar transport system permease subunit
MMVTTTRTRQAKSARAQARRSLAESILSMVFCGPALLVYTGFIILPAVLGFLYSLTSWNGWNRHPKFVGLANFAELLHDKQIVSIIGFTVKETVMLMIVFIFGAMILAVLLDRLRVMKGLIRGIFFYPYILSLLVSALIFVYMANYREGLVNTLFDLLHLGGWKQDWMGDPALAPYFIFVLVAWGGLGFFTTLYLANLQTIPTELFDAAKIDGAGPVAIFSKIQFPMLIPTITTNSVLALLTGVNLFAQILVTTDGGPGYRTTFTIGYYIYHLGIKNDRQGYAAAISFVTFVALVIIAFIQVALLRRKEVTL